MNITQSDLRESRRQARAQRRRQIAAICRLLGLAWRKTILGCCAAMRWLSQVCRWLYLHIGSPVLCFVCIYLGVMLTLSLPVSMWTWLIMPVITNLPADIPTSFPLATLPTQETLVRAMLSGLPIAVVVFRRTYAEWKSSAELLVAKMLYACHAGVTWAVAWFRRRAEPPGS
jgi:hypothetical protein